MGNRGKESNRERVKNAALAFLISLLEYTKKVLSVVTMAFLLTLAGDFFTTFLASKNTNARNSLSQELIERRIASLDKKYKKGIGAPSRIATSKPSNANHAQAYQEQNSLEHSGLSPSDLEELFAPEEEPRSSILALGGQLESDEDETKKANPVSQALFGAGMSFASSGDCVSAKCSNPGSQPSECVAIAGTYWTNATSSDVSLSGVSSLNIPTGYQSGASLCSVTDSALSAANIVYGTSILGVSGTYRGIVLASNMHRDVSSTQLTQVAEVEAYAGTNNLPIGYRAIPKISKDDDGGNAVNVTLVDRTGWGTTTCGLSGSIATRISNCSTTFGANATWNGALNGNSGQGTWKLVTRRGNISGNTGKEVWQDQRTQLLWSSILGRNSSNNWCKASGHNNIAGNPGAEDDPNDFCDNAANQNTAGQAVSACYEDNGTNFTQTDAGITNDDDGKGGLHYNTSPSVAWRLPSRNDYMQADINGIRYVMPEMAAIAGFGEWTSTISHSNSNAAHVFNGKTGVLGVILRNQVNLGIRCVGR